MTEAKYAIWDCETTGVEVHEDQIVQFFFATTDAVGNLIETHEWFIDPGIEVPEEAAAVHGFSTEFLRVNGQNPEVALEEIRKTFTEHLDLTHSAFNMSFDLSILDAEFKRYGISDRFGEYMRDKVRLVDGLVIDRAKDRYRKGKRTLKAQAEHYGVPFNEGDLHNARADVELTAKVTVRILEKFGTPTTAQQAAWYRDWAENFQQFLRKENPEAVVDSSWPLKLREDS